MSLGQLKSILANWGQPGFSWLGLARLALVLLNHTGSGQVDSTQT